MKKLKVKSKKLLSILLVLIMAVQVFPSATFAQSGESQSGSEENAVVGDEGDEIDSQADVTVTEEDADSGEEVTGTDESEGNSLPEGWTPGAGTRTVSTNTDDDVTSYINFTDVELSYTNNVISPGDDLTFKYGTYIFSFKWTVDFITLGTTLIAGDYFTFQVPELFANKDFDVKDSDGIVMARLTIDGEGNGRITFNDEVEGLSSLKGSVSLSVRYEEDAAGESVDWKFVFDDTYEYKGESEGRVIPSTSINKDNTKQGWTVGSNGSQVSWTARINIQQEAWTGQVMVEDSLGSDHKMKTIFSMDTKLYGYYGLDNYRTVNYYGTTNNDETRAKYYFAIAVIDWDTMRDDYNKLLEWNRLQGNQYIQYCKSETGTSIYDTGGEIITSTYEVSTSDLNFGVSNFMYNLLLEYKNKSGQLMYASPYTGGLESVIVTDSGFELIFPEGAMDKTAYQIRYYTVVSSPISPDTVDNTITVSGSTPSDDAYVKVSITEKADIIGNKGEILLYKYNAEGTVPLSGVSFSLTETSIPYSKTVKTDENGAVKFELLTNGNGNGYEGTYTLKEEAAPSGYLQMEDIILKLNSEGEIIEVNGTAISGRTTIVDGAGNRICQISADRLGLIVYNEEIPVGGFEVTKVDSDNNGKTLPGAKFYLYYEDEDDGTEMYYTDNGGWSADRNDAKDLETNSSGKLKVTGLEYGTYFLEEIAAPSGYQIKETPTTITIDKETIQSITIENTAKAADFEFCKVDADELDEFTGGVITGLENARFELYVYNSAGTCSKHSGLVTAEGVADGCWTLIDTQISDTNGMVKFEGLKEIYIYQLVEAAAPVGYQLPSGQWKIEVTDATANKLEDRFTISLMGDADLLDFEAKAEAYYLGNSLQLIEFTFLKVDASDRDEILPGAKFSLYICNTKHTHGDGSGCTWDHMDDAESGLDGVVNFEDLVPGYYKLEETEAPTGYELPTGHWLITLLADGTLDEESISASVNGYTLAIVHENGMYKILNQKSFILPLLASSSNIRILTVAGIALLFVGGLIGLRMKRKRRTII